MTDTTKQTTTSDSSGGPAPLYDQARALGRYLRAFGMAADRAAQQAERGLFTARLRDADTLRLDVAVEAAPGADLAAVEEGDPLALEPQTFDPAAPRGPIGARERSGPHVLRVTHSAVGTVGTARVGAWIEPIWDGVDAGAMHLDGALRAVLHLPDLTPRT